MMTKIAKWNILSRRFCLGQRGYFFNLYLVGGGGSSNTFVGVQLIHVLVTDKYCRWANVPLSRTLIILTHHFVSLMVHYRLPMPYSPPPRGGRLSPAVACWASDHWVASSNPLRGKFRH